MSKKRTAHQKKFGKAFKACKRQGKKPFTKSFGSCMSAEMKKKR